MGDPLDGVLQGHDVPPQTRGDPSSAEIAAWLWVDLHRAPGLESLGPLLVCLLPGACVSECPINSTSCYVPIPTSAPAPVAPVVSRFECTFDHGDHRGKFIGRQPQRAMPGQKTQLERIESSTRQTYKLLTLPFNKRQNDKGAQLPNRFDGPAAEGCSIHVTAM